ncbi:MAG: hypothetical protein KDA16_00925 [Phycisphaerales bacterium]|nr:hypothetical protein [Phycisphaerales bacterium]
MASSRQVAKLVLTVGSVSSGAILTLLGETQTTKSGLDAVPMLVHLVASSLFIQTEKATPEDLDRAQAFLCRLIRRYGTARQALEAISTGHRRHPHLSIERAHIWMQALSVTPGLIDSTLRRHTAFNRMLTEWLDRRGHEIDKQLDAYRAWLDGPLTGAEAEWALPGMNVSEAAAGSEESEASSQAQTGSPESQGSDASIEDIDLIRSVVLGDKYPGDDPSFLPLTPQQREAAHRLAGSRDHFGRALAAVAFADFVRADTLLASLPESVPPEENYTLRGDRLYYDGRFDDALSEYIAARHTKDDLQRRLNVAVALMRSTRGTIDDAYKQATDLLAATKLDLRADSPDAARIGLLLGAACVHRPSVDRAQCIERAIDHFEGALVTISREKMPDLWAQAHYQLGIAWLDAPSGDRAENLQKATRHLGMAAEVWTRDENPGRWAIVHNAAGHAWERAPRGNRASNLERALICFSAALEVRTEAADPIGWARLQNNLANVWMQLPSGDHAENIQRAIECQARALEVWSREGRRVEWAATQSNLGNAWALLPAKDDLRDRNLRRAIACYKSALEVRTRSAHPIEWAATLNNLGTALLHLPPNKKGDTVKEAVTCFTQALEVRTRDQFPLDWAKTQANLGQAWIKMPAGDVIENLQESVAYFQCALEVYDANRYPHQHNHVKARLGEARKALEDAESRYPKATRG